MIEDSLARSLALKYGTPLYVYDFDVIKNEVLDFKEAFRARKSIICYALKANSNIHLLKYLASLDLGADCVSINEVKLALKANIKPYKIIFSGVGKSEEDILSAIKSNILMLNCESEEELYLIESIAKRENIEARISIRVNPDVNPNTHPYISTGLNENKFGVDTQSALKLYKFAAKSKSLNPVGIHFHIGSQMLDLAPIIESAQKIIELINQLQALKIELKFFDIGGGLGINYSGEQTIKLYDYAQGILAQMSGLNMTIICEPGRRIVGNAGVLISKVLYEKSNQKKRFCIVDAAMNDLIRPSLYGATHEIKHISLNPNLDSKNLDSKVLDSKHECADIVGPICESGDYLAKNVKLDRARNGDLILFKSAGAYGFSMASNYNSRLKPAEVAIINGSDTLIRRRENLDDLLRTQENLGSEV